MKRLKRLFVLSLLTVTAVFTAGTNEANAASKLTPEHLYTWAKDNDTARLNKYKHYINIENQDKNTALCLAQQDQNRDAYALLLQFGASTKVPCHNDNDPVCAMIVGEKIKVSPAGMALIGAGAAAAGAYALLHDDDDKGCNVKNYPLAECPEHGHCSECKDKKRLDTCDEFWTPNADKTACIPADCPANQYTSCEDKADHITTATPTTSKSGDQQCYQCSYKCNETDNRYDNLGFCAAAHAGIVCELNENQCWYPARCDTAKGYYDTDADCRTGNFGYTCKIAANNCYEKDVCDVANGHHPDQTSCENANTGYHCTQQENLCWQPDFTLLTECPSGSHTALCETKTGVISTSNATGKSGPDDCLACDYKCDSANGWKQGTSAADCPLGRICSDISINDTNRSQTLTCYHDDGCPADYTYTSQSTCEEGGYTCAESAAGSQCWKRTGNADCPDTHPNRTQCQTGTGYTNGQTQTQVGSAPCYNCNYQCDTANNWLSACPSGKVCSEITMPSGAKCYTPTGCDTSNGYFDNTNTCQNANPEHICTLDSTGCYVVGACDAAHGYYASDTACTTANPSYTCVKTEHNCYIKNAPAACPVPSHINSCLNTDGIKTTPTVVGKSGEDDCYDCTYLCDTANGWQSGSESNCPTGWICKYASLTDPYRSKGADCYKKDYCNTTQGYYDTDSACTTANSEYTCIVDATGCYTKNICNTSKGYYA
ncbi:MAG: hypothetical protein J6C85_00570, partial [Alphaproteobacteria bacterium]|nr:hypothetical protein [Alphaproteobacteria bacterium]